MGATATTPGPATTGAKSNPLGHRLQGIGGGILRYGLVFFLVAFGAYKFTQEEALAIQPLVSNSPLLGWLTRLFDMRTVSGIIGVIEIVTGVAMGLRRVAPRISALGSLGAVATFMVTLSFLFTTPGVGSSPMGFAIMKDFFLLGAACWCAGEAFQAADASSTA
jgi:uncharacterized membrane protein YkgB